MLLLCFKGTMHYWDGWNKICHGVGYPDDWASANTEYCRCNNFESVVDVLVVDGPVGNQGTTSNTPLAAAAVAESDEH